MRALLIATPEGGDQNCKGRRRQRIPPCCTIDHGEKARRFSDCNRHCEPFGFAALYYMASDKYGPPYETPAHFSSVTGRSAADDTCSSSERFQEIAQIANHVVSECLAARCILHLPSTLITTHSPFTTHPIISLCQLNVNLPPQSFLQWRPSTATGRPFASASSDTASPQPMLMKKFTPRCRTTPSRW